MNIGPTPQGGIRIDVDSLADWSRLELIARDAAKIEGGLARALASKMTIEADWQDYVMPDIEAYFSEQLQFIQREIRIARSADPHRGEVHIIPENVGLWYGALNQARLALEHEFNLSQFEGPLEEPFKDLDEPCRRALYKSEFYGSLQMYLLEYVM